MVEVILYGYCHCLCGSSFYFPCGTENCLIFHRKTAQKLFMLFMKKSVFIWVILLLTTCAPYTTSTTQRIDDRDVAFSSIGTGSPIVVFEAGMGQTMNTWSKVFCEVSKFTRVFAYNRPGYGRSSLHNTPKTGRNIVDKLRGTLKATGNNPPYILVGHSLGGLFINLYARMYPDEVAGVLFIDASHPDLFQHLRKENRFWYFLIKAYSSRGKTKYEKNISRNIHKEFNQGLPFPDIPVIVMTAEKTFSIFGSKKMRKQWLKYQTDLSSLSTESSHRIIRGSGHMIQNDKPEEVIRAIRELISTVRAQQKNRGIHP